MRPLLVKRCQACHSAAEDLAERGLTLGTSIECLACGGDIRLIAFITEPGPIRKILTHLGEPLEPLPISSARGPPTDRGELMQVHADRDIFQTSPDVLPAIDTDSL
ncbi:MAG: hypothetical protein ACO3NZ_06855 [Pirellulales bacterium]